MASIDGGTLASQKELKCQINSVRAPDTQEFLYLAPWEADKDRLCVSEQALTKHWGFFFFTPLLPASASSSSSSFCRLNGGAGACLLTWPLSLSCTRQTSLVWHVSAVKTQMHPWRLTHIWPQLSDRHQSSHNIPICILFLNTFVYVWIHSWE